MQFAASGIVAQLAGRIAQRVEYALRRIAFHPPERAGHVAANRPLQAVCRQRELARTFQRLAERFPGLLPRGRDDFSIVRGILRADRRCGGCGRAQCRLDGICHLRGGRIIADSSIRRFAGGLCHKRQG